MIAKKFSIDSKCLKFFINLVQTNNLSHLIYIRNLYTVTHISPFPQTNAKEINFMVSLFQQKMGVKIFDALRIMSSEMVSICLPSKIFLFSYDWIKMGKRPNIIRVLSTEYGQMSIDFCWDFIFYLNFYEIKFYEIDTIEYPVFISMQMKILYISWFLINNK